MSQFNDPKLQTIFLRVQTKPIEEVWEPTTWRRIISGYNFDLGIAAVIYIFAIATAISVVLISGVMQRGSGPGLQIILGTAVFGTFIELLRRTYDSAIKRLAAIDLFTSEILSIARIF